jgi:hypothetical protein
VTYTEEEEDHHEEDLREDHSDHLEDHSDHQEEDRQAEALLHLFLQPLQLWEEETTSW